MTSDRPMKPLKPWLTLALTIAGGILAAFGQHLRTVTGPETHGFWLGLTLFGVTLTAVVVWFDKLAKEKTQASHEQELERIRDEHEKELDEQTSAARVALEDALDPLIESLGAVAAAPEGERRHEVNSVVIQGLHAITHVVGRSSAARIRASYFRVSQRSERKVELHLRRVESTGRAGTPRDRFLADEPDGKVIFDMLEKDATKFVANIKREPPPGMDVSRNRDYETFISVPARVRDKIDGMLTVDAPAEGDLHPSDVPFIRAVGTAIATAALLGNDASLDEGTDPSTRAGNRHRPDVP